MALRRRLRQVDLFARRLESEDLATPSRKAVSCLPASKIQRDDELEVRSWKPVTRRWGRERSLCRVVDEGRPVRRAPRNLACRDRADHGLGEDSRERIVPT